MRGNPKSKIGKPKWYEMPQVGDFELLAPLGSGGQATVYLVRPWTNGVLQRGLVRHRLRRMLHQGRLDLNESQRWQLGALKVAHPDASDALLDEYGYLAAPGAQHPQLSQLYQRCYGGPSPDLGLTRLGVRAGVRPYLGLAYAPGARLSRRLASGRIGGTAWALTVVSQLAAALDHLHQRGIVHHDVRPANIVVDERANGPHATLLDLGAAETPGAPRRRGVYGAAAWLAPECQAPPSAPVTPLVDVYGLGRVLAALLGNATPVEPALQRLIDAATAPDPQQRAACVPDMAALQAGLRAYASL